MLINSITTASPSNNSEGLKDTRFPKYLQRKKKIRNSKLASYIIIHAVVKDKYKTHWKSLISNDN